MIGNTVIQVPSSSMIACPRGSPNGIPYLSSKPRTRHFPILTLLMVNHFQMRVIICSVLFWMCQGIYETDLKPLSDFGFGKRSVWEGGVGFFIVFGATLLALSWGWLRCVQMRSTFRKYQTVFDFDLSQASSICTGTPVRIRWGFCRSLHLLQIEDDMITIPKNSLVELNQFGFLMETMIDIMPRDPLPEPSLGPLHPQCGKEGLIVCDRQNIKTEQGVSLDELVGIFTRIGREVEVIGLANTYSLAERAASVIEEAKPLLKKVM